MNLEEHIEQIRIGIKSGRFTNEAAVSQGIVLRILDALSWPTYDTQIICPEYSLQGRRVDFALCHPPGKPIAFVEVKQIGQSQGAERQLFEYAFHEGVPLAILTDGQEWNFFLPGEQGDYGERRVYKLDIVERDISECVDRLNRYLQYNAIVLGAAIEAAREDYRNVSRDRQMKQTLPKAWERILEEEDELLIELLADRVESLCGFKPHPDTVAQFLKENVAIKSTGGANTRESSRTILNISSKSSHHVPRSVKPSSIGFMLNGKFFSARNALGVLEGFFEEINKHDATFLERFALLPKHGRTRRYLAKNPDDLYPGRPDLVRDHSTQLTSGWWLSTNHSRTTIKRIIEMASGVANLKFEKDIQINIGE
ncbi:MAG: hypothetical protein KBF68_01060 [Nitrosomonas sp.]|jgi:predicted type IV restriction endonuclease|nr:hypothetical protein [Nitrosomonas sp.]MBP9099972.1 hypothetical protein [Nitrosomonas sp.]